MQDNTFTFTARSGQDPDKSATFTLNNGTVSVELGNVLVEQVTKAYESLNDEGSESRKLSWVKPAATGTLQKIIEPIPLADFEAEMSGEALQTKAWIRAGGRRLAPVMMTWRDVDNPQGAAAFVNEFQERKEAIVADEAAPDPLDYWISWVVMGLVALALPILFVRLFRKLDNDK